MFSEDTKTLVTDGKRALRLRKWLCKSWWNDDFRDRLMGLMAHLSGGQPTMQIPLGEDVVAVIQATPLSFLSPLTYVRRNATAESENAIEDDPDEEVLSPADIAADAKVGDDDDDELDDEEFDEGVEGP